MVGCIDRIACSYHIMPAILPSHVDSSTTGVSKACGQCGRRFEGNSLRCVLSPFVVAVWPDETKRERCRSKGESGEGNPTWFAEYRIPEQYRPGAPWQCIVWCSEQSDICWEEDHEVCEVRRVSVCAQSFYVVANCLFELLLSLLWNGTLHFYSLYHCKYDCYK